MMSRIIATRAGCESALAYFARILSFTENSSDLLVPIIYYRNITMIILINK
jgi:hypothetical protein